MKTKLKKARNAVAALLLAAIFAISLSACAGTASVEPEPEIWHPTANLVTTTAAPCPVSASVEETKPVEAVAPEVPDTAVPQDGPVETPSVASAEVTVSMSSVKGVARLKGLVGNYAMKLFRDAKGTYVVVDTEDGHNPYDLVWRYGPKDTKKQKDVKDPEWDALYRSYVDACDWSLVFDAEYYKKAFPMLAKLYHDNDELLLEHFQTQGVHEGRQASASFNVAAYMAHCGKSLVKAFGEDYECYYFYYMLNHAKQKSVDASNKDGKYDRWLTLELSLQQSQEYKDVNRYREEADVEPVELDPEMVAFANYRAWYDAEHNVYGHDWGSDRATANDLNDCLERLCNYRFTENTVKWYSTSGSGGYEGFAGHYATSKSHYDAMVDGKYVYAGYSNPYLSDNPDNPFAKKPGANGTKYVCQFDLFTEKQCNSPYELD